MNQNNVLLVDKSIPLSKIYPSKIKGCFTLWIFLIESNNKSMHTLLYPIDTHISLVHPQDLSPPQLLQNFKPQLMHCLEIATHFLFQSIINLPLTNWWFHLKIPT